MSDNEEIVDIFNKRKQCSFRLPNINDDTVKLEFEFSLNHGEQWMIKHMRPSSLSWCCQKDKPIKVTASFEQYKPTRWELFRDWLHSKICRCERYW